MMTRMGMFHSNIRTPEGYWFILNIEMLFKYSRIKCDYYALGEYATLTQVKSFKLREFKPKDLQSVVSINWKCLPENYSSQFFLELYEHYPKSFIVVEADGQIVGYIMCRIETGISEFKRPIFGIAKKGHIVSIAVLSEYRRCGIATELINQAMRRMLEYGATECYLEVRKTNDAAVNLYKKLGFEILRKISGYYYDGEDAYVMGWKLKKFEH